MAISEADFAAGRISPGSFQHKRRPSSPVSSTSLNHIHLAEALLNSEDNGATLDLSHRNLTDVGEYGAEELAAIGREDLMEDESSLLRITLASNRLATLPMAFALLSRLRYLNLKNNSFSVFPDVLTIMPSLEVLDIGRNKLKRLPSQPGSLVNLRVFSIYKNRISRLPSYLVKFQKLNILRIEQNPLEWPPKSVVESQDVSKDWIKGLQKWIEDNSSASEHRKVGDNSMQGDQGEPSLTRGANHDDALFFRPIAGATNWNNDKDLSVTFDAESSFRPFFSSPRMDRPPPLQLGSLPRDRDQPSPSSRSPESYLPTPEGSASPDAAADLFPDTSSHARNASYAGSSSGSVRNSLRKKSLPDMRPAKLRLGVDIRNPDIPSYTHTTGFATALKANNSVDHFTIPSPLSQRQDSSESEGSSFVSNTARPFAQTQITSSPTSVDRPAPAMDVERNSYFRRFSTLASLAISKTIPDSLLKLVDAIRGILFAVSQIYQTLRHYTVYAIDERLSSVLVKVLDPASAYMTQLINALDRFDAMSRRTIPTPSVCRGVIESCKDNVAVFGKAVGVLALQLKVLATHDDVRFTRQMLLVLYSAMAEISHAWNSVTPYIGAIEPFLRGHCPPATAKSRPVKGSTTPLTGPMDVPPASAPAVAPAFLPQLPDSPLPDSPGGWRTHMARRHAGSFSIKDVEIGRSLPSSIDVPQFQAGVATTTDTPTPRAALRLAGYFPPFSGAPMTARVASPSRAPLKGSPYYPSVHSRQGSQTSLGRSPSISSPVLNHRMPALDTPSDLTTLVDKEALDAMTKAVEAAPSVWDMVDAVLADMPEKRLELGGALETAQYVTRQLKDSIAILQDGGHVDRKTTREDAHLFIKTVVQLSNTMKAHGGSHPLSSALRTNMVKLTNATEELVILLHVSSFSSSQTPRPYSPMTPAPGVPSHGALHLSEDINFGPSLSRTHSLGAETPSKTRLPSPSARDLPQSAMPSQSFTIPTPPRRFHKGVSDDALDGL